MVKVEQKRSKMKQSQRGNNGERNESHKGLGATVRTSEKVLSREAT